MLLSLLVLLVVAGVILWGVGQLPIDATIARIIKVLVVVIVVLYALQLLTGRHILPGLT